MAKFDHLQHDFSPYDVSFHQLQKHRMFHPPIHERDLFHPRPQRLHRAIDFGNHAPVNHPRLLQTLHFPGLQSRNQRLWRLGIAQQSRNIARKNQPPGLQRARHRGGSHVGVAIVYLPIRASGRWTDHRRNPFVQTFQQRLRIDNLHFAHKPRVQPFPACAKQTELLRQVRISAPENPRALPPSLLIVLTICGLISRDSTRSTTSTAAAFVTRIPWTNLASSPAPASAAVIAFPPPCTSTGLIPTVSSKTTSRATPSRTSGSGESIKLPPYLTTNVAPCHCGRLAIASSAPAFFGVQYFHPARMNGPRPLASEFLCTFFVPPTGESSSKAMINNLKTFCSRLAPALGALLVLAAGCVERRITWSRDGAHAAIFSEKGLYLCDPDGKLSGLLVTNSQWAEWFPDSHRLAVACTTKIHTWGDLRDLLLPEERQRIEQNGKIVFDALSAGRDLNGTLSSLDGLTDMEKTAAQTYARDKAGANWSGPKLEDVEVMQLRVGNLVDGKIALGPPLCSTLRKIFDLRVSPYGNAIAFTTESGKNDAFMLWVAPADGSAPAQLVAPSAALSSDWSPDSQSLVYIKSTTTVNKADQLSLGSVTRQGVFNAAGKFEIQPATEDLAGLLFEAYDKVRCLPDGRIIFAAADIHFPCTSLDMPQQPQLFAIDPARQQAVIPLVPRSVQDSLPFKPSSYETSPDGRRVAVSSDKSGVIILTLATGQVETVQADGDKDIVSAPVWRSADELCYISVTNGRPAQVALWSNGLTRILSANWPSDVRTNFLDR